MGIETQPLPKDYTVLQAAEFYAAKFATDYVYSVYYNAEPDEIDYNYKNLVIASMQWCMSAGKHKLRELNSKIDETVSGAVDRTGVDFNFLRMPVATRTTAREIGSRVRSHINIDHIHDPIQILFMFDTGEMFHD